MGKRNIGIKKAANIKSSKREYSGDWSLDRVLIVIIKSMVYVALFTPLIVVSDFFFPFVGPKSIIFMGAVQVLFAAYVLLIIYYPEYRPKFNILAIALLSYLGILILTTLTGVNPMRSFWSNQERMTGLLMWFHLVAFFMVISSVFKTQRDWRDVFLVTVSFAAIVAFIFILEDFGARAFDNLRGGSTIGNTSFMGVYLLFNAFLAVFLALKNQTWIKYYSIALVLVIVTALFLSDAIASILGFVAGLGLILLLYLVCMTNKIYLKTIGAFAILIAVIGAFVLGVLLFVPESFVRQEFIRFDTEARLTAWAASWRGVVERPWLGWGPENLNVPFMRHFDPRLYLPEHGAEVWFDRAHNIILDTLIASGIIGLIAYMGIFAAAFMLLWKHFLRRKEEFWLAAIFSAALIAYFIQNLTVFDMINSYLMFLLMLGHISAMPHNEEMSSARKPARRLVLFYAAPVLIVFCFAFHFFTVSPWISGSFVARAMRPYDLNDMLYSYGRAIGDSPLGRNDIRLHFAQQFQAFSISEEGLQLDRNTRDKVLRYLEEELQKNIAENPMDYKAHIELARFYNTWARFDASKAYRARRILDKALLLSPRNQIGFWTLAQTMVFLNDGDKALNAAERAVELEPRLLQSHEMVIRVAVTVGNNALAQEKLNRALNINPVWEGHLRQFVGED